MDLRKERVGGQSWSRGFSGCWNGVVEKRYRVCCGACALRLWIYSGRQTAQTGASESAAEVLCWERPGPARKRTSGPGDTPSCTCAQRRRREGGACVVLVR